MQEEKPENKILIFLRFWGKIDFSKFCESGAVGAVCLYHCRLMKLYYTRKHEHTQRYNVNKDKNEITNSITI